MHNLWIIAAFCIILLAFSSFGAEKRHKYVKDLKPRVEKCSWFRLGPKSAINPHLKRRYVAMRWDYDALARRYNVPEGRIKAWLRECVRVNVHYGDRAVEARIADWGPNPRLDRGIDLSYDLMVELGAETDDPIMCSFRILE